MNNAVVTVLDVTVFAAVAMACFPFLRSPNVREGAIRYSGFARTAKFSTSAAADAAKNMTAGSRAPRDELRSTKPIRVFAIVHKTEQEGSGTDA